MNQDRNKHLFGGHTLDEIQDAPESFGNPNVIEAMAFSLQGFISGRSEADKIQIGGDHYKQKPLQPWQVIEAFGLDFFEGNAIKYILRYRDKNGREDLEKAQHYLQKVMERYEAEFQEGCSSTNEFIREAERLSAESDKAFQEIPVAFEGSGFFAANNQAQEG